MLKAVVAATAAVTIAGSSLPTLSPKAARMARAAGSPPPRTCAPSRLRGLLRCAPGLMLTADQEKHWPAFEQAMRELQQLRLNRITAIREARREGRQPVTDPAERMRQRATRLSESGAVLKRLADATEPLYRSLDDARSGASPSSSRTEGPRGGWQRRGRDGGERGMPRGHRRTDAAPVDVVPQSKGVFMRKTVDGETAGPMFTRKTIDGDVFAQAFVSKTVDGVLVGRVFGTKTVDGDLTVGEAALFTGKTLEPVAFSGKVVTAEPGTFGRKITIGKSPVFGRKAVTSI